MGGCREPGSVFALGSDAGETDHSPARGHLRPDVSAVLFCESINAPFT